MYCSIFSTIWIFYIDFFQTWADAFKGHPELKEVEKVYLDLKKKGIEFPMTDLDKMAPIHTPARVCDKCLIFEITLIGLFL